MLCYNRVLCMLYTAVSIDIYYNLSSVWRAANVDAQAAAWFHIHIITL